MFVCVCVCVWGGLVLKASTLLSLNLKHRRSQGLECGMPILSLVGFKVGIIISNLEPEAEQLEHFREVKITIRMYLPPRSRSVIAVAACLTNAVRAAKQIRKLTLVYMGTSIYAGLFPR